MPITKIAHSVLEENQENYINILRLGHSIADSGWTTYSDLAGINPVDGFGTGAGITWSQNTVNPLSGDVDLRLVKDASNRQGNGVSIPFTIANRHLGKVLQISFDMELISGNYENPIPVPVTGTYSITSTTCTVTASHSFVQGQFVFMTFTSGTRPADGYYTITSVTATTFVFTVASGSGTGNCNYTAIGDLRVSIIQNPDSVTPVMIEPVNTNLQLGIMNQKIRHIASFQTHISITSYRLCIHVGSGSTVAYTVDFNNFRVWEPTQSIGSIITDWVNYTPSITQGLGTISNNTLRWRRVGSSVEVIGDFTIGTVTGDEARIGLPLGLTANISNHTAGTSEMVGYLFRDLTAVQMHFSLHTKNGFSYVNIGRLRTDTSINPFVPEVGSTLFGNSNIVSIMFSVPIQGWGSSVFMSSDSGDGRLVAARYYTNSTTTTRVTNTLAYQTRSYDTHNAYNTTTGVYTIPIQGIYQIRYADYFTTSGNGIGIYRNGSIYRLYVTYGPSAYTGNGVDTILCNAGDTIELRISDGTLANSGSLVQFFSIERISAGSQIISTAETVVAVATKESGSWSDNTIVTWSNKQIDSHGALNISTGEFTCPMNGKYLITANLHPNNFFTGSGATTYSAVQIRKNATIIARSSNYWNGSATILNLGMACTHIVDCIAGDKLSIYGGGTWTVETGKFSHLSIMRIGI